MRFLALFAVLFVPITCSAELTVTFDATGPGLGDDRSFQNFYGVSVSGDSDDYIKTIRMEINPVTDFFWSFEDPETDLDANITRVFSVDVIDGIEISTLEHPYEEAATQPPPRFESERAIAIDLMFPPNLVETGDSFRFSMIRAIDPLRPSGVSSDLPGGEWADVLRITATTGSGLTDYATLQFVDRFQSIATMTLVPEPGSLTLVIVMISALCVFHHCKFGVVGK